MKFEEMKELVLVWADDKDLLHIKNADKQFMKFVEEVFEFKDSFTAVKLAGQLWGAGKKPGCRYQF